MQLRKAKRGDLRYIVEMLADDDLGSTREDFRFPVPASYMDAFENISLDPNQELMVVENMKGEIIGTMQLTFIQYLTYQGGIRAQLEAVRIHKNHRGTGLGTEMIKWAISKARKKGAHVVQLTTDKKRLDALRFYRDLGFVDSHEGMKLHL
jgi:GNAT superfamily N-acetyltransferase